VSSLLLSFAAVLALEDTLIGTLVRCIVAVVFSRSLLSVSMEVLETSFLAELADCVFMLLVAWLLEPITFASLFSLDVCRLYRRSVLFIRDSLLSLCEPLLIWERGCACFISAIEFFCFVIWDVDFVKALVIVCVLRVLLVRAGVGDLGGAGDFGDVKVTFWPMSPSPLNPYLMLWARVGCMYLWVADGVGVFRFSTCSWLANRSVFLELFSVSSLIDRVAVVLVWFTVFLSVFVVFNCGLNDRGEVL